MNYRIKHTRSGRVTVANERLGFVPRRLSPETRTSLIETSARLLAKHGPDAVSTRRISAEVGASTMAVYTYFGGMSGLVREVVHEGFMRLNNFMMRVRHTEDAVADVIMLGRAYRHNALMNSHLYTVMFGGSSLGGFELTDEDREHGRYTLKPVATCTARCVEAGRFRSADPELLATEFWIATHGHVTLEMGGYLNDPYPADLCFESQLAGLMCSAGDSPDRTAESLARSRARFPVEVLGERAEEEVANQ